MKNIIGNNIKKHRISAGMSVLEVSLYSGLPQSTIVDIESGQHQAGKTELSLIAHAYGVSACDLS